MTLEVTFQWMQIPAIPIHIVGGYGTIEESELSAQLVGVRGLDAGLRAGLENFSKPLCLKLLITTLPSLVHSVSKHKTDGKRNRTQRGHLTVF